MRIKVGGQNIKINQQDALGSGGEGFVAKIGDKRVAKIYHTPTRVRSDKIKAFLSLGATWPNNVLAPMQEVLSGDGRNVVGFTMPLAKGGEEIYSLSNRSYRQQNGITTRDIFQIGLHARTTIDAIHQLHVIIGDLNDLGVMFDIKTKKVTIWLDVDSFSIPGFPCIVAMESFLDPRLYGKSFDDGSSYFSLESDYYAYMVMLFKSLFTVHPYGGVHPKFKDIPQRASNLIDVMHPQVRYPKRAAPLEIVSDDLLQLFHLYFRKGERPVPDVGLFQRELDGLRECPSCGVWFTSSRSNCPGCSAAAKVVLPPTAKPTDKTIVVDNVEYTKWFETKGTIAHFQEMGDDAYIWVVFNDNGTTFYRTKGSQVVHRSKVYDKQIHGFHISATKNFLVISKNDEMVFMDIRGSDAKEVSRLKTGTFNDRPMTASSENYIYRVKGYQILCGKDADLLQNRFMETQVASAVEEQTWFRVSAEGTIVGFHRVFNDMKWFITSKKDGQFTLQIQIIPTDARLADVSVKFDDKRGTILVMRKAVHSDGTEHMYLDVLRRNDGTLVRAYVDNSDQEIHGRAIMGPSVFHPTDDGLVLEQDSKTSKSFPATRAFVGEGDLLFPYTDGVLVVGDKKIGYLRVVKN